MLERLSFGKDHRSFGNCKSWLIFLGKKIYFSASSSARVFFLIWFMCFFLLDSLADIFGAFSIVFFLIGFAIPLPPPPPPPHQN